VKCPTIPDRTNAVAVGKEAGRLQRKTVDKMVPTIRKMKRLSDGLEDNG